VNAKLTDLEWMVVIGALCHAGQDAATGAVTMMKRARESRRLGQDGVAADRETLSKRLQENAEELLALAERLRVGL
jgi:hypothetical protein